MLNPLELVLPEKRRHDGGYVWFVVDPDKLYPAMLEFKRSQLPKGIQLAVDNVEALSPADRAARAIILEQARLEFTAMLHAAIGHRPMGLHILRRPRWRL